MNIYKIIHVLPRIFRRHKIVRMLLFFSPSSRVQLITFNHSGKLFADISDPYARSYLIAGTFEPEFFSIAKPFLSNGGVFFDVGANFGFCTFGLIGCLAHHKVAYHLFEANEAICQSLLQSAKLHPDQAIQINHCCVTDSPGISKLFIDCSNFGASFISDRGIQKVSNLILDNYIQDNLIEKISFLKLDIEGWEPRAIRGAMNSLTKGRVDAVYIEIATANLSRAGFCSEDCFTLLRDAGFRLFYVRAIDFESGVAHKNKTVTLHVNGYPLMVAELEKFPTEYHTDILAIHKSSGLLSNYVD